MSTDVSGFTTFKTAVDALETRVESEYWTAFNISADGAQCANAVQAVINSGPEIYTIICTDNDASQLEGHIVMPDGWDNGTLTFELGYIQTAADTNVLHGDVSAQCRNDGTVVNNTFGTPIAMDDAALVGSSSFDVVTSAAVTADGTCAEGDLLMWRWEMDATGTTTGVATLHFIGMKMEYTVDTDDQP